LSKYEEKFYLPLSGIQHFVFCKRQWALIHIERQWKENLLTVEGKQLHERVDNPYEKEKRCDLIISRSMPLISHKMGIQGVADVVEFERTTKDKGMVMEGHSGLWLPYPIEYKRGNPKVDRSDEAQLTLQVLCIEEMLETSIEKAYIYYHQKRRRTKVKINNEMREWTVSMVEEMNNLFERGITPPAEKSKKCSNCSMKEICSPRLTKKYRPVKNYINDMMKEVGQ